MNEHPVVELMKDHRLIEKVMTALEQRLAEDEFPADFVSQALAFFVEFADAHHHYKEEEGLFPAMARLGFTVEGGPIAAMLNEHTMGRKLLAGIRDNLEKAKRGDAKACAAVRGYATQYIELLRQHIWKEDNVLFRMAQQAMDEKATAALREHFDKGPDSKASAKAARVHASFAAAL